MTLERIIKTLAIGLIILSLASCSTDKNTSVSRAYHNVTARYNVYFNGNEALKAGVAKIEKAYPDNFSELLPIYKESNPKTAKTAQGDMDLAIIKATKLIKLHSITKKPKRRKNRTEGYKRLMARKEYNNWVDNAYLLMGKAYFYQHNYLLAITNFLNIIQNYESLNDVSTRYESYLWLIRSYIETERFTEAEDLIARMQTDSAFPIKFRGELALINADFNIKQGQYAEAIPLLEQAIELIHKKKRRLRYRYILAQLYQDNDDLTKATSLYRKVIKMNPEYDMAFSAKINIAASYNTDTDAEKLQKELRKMIRDQKNVDFLDQIYFAQANLFRKLQKEPEALDSYIEAAKHSEGHDGQRITICTTIGKLYLEKENYLKAASYYDSAFVLMDQNYQSYDEIAVLAKNLKSLGNNLGIVVKEDSLQRYAQMDEKERNKIIDAIIKELAEKKRLENEQQKQEQSDRSFFQNNSSRLSAQQYPGQQTNSFYFYNPTTVAYGISEFQRKWGKRKLEDNWRRKSKQEVLFGENGELIAAENANDSLTLTTPKRIDNKSSREYYLQDLPINDSLMTISNQKIEDALFNAGRIFHIDFENNPKAIECFEQLIRRFNNSEYELSTLFELYELHREEGSTSSANKYKKDIVDKYPNSKYAQYIQNPNFFKELQDKEDRKNQLYRLAFKQFQRKQYIKLLATCENLEALKPDSLLIPKIEFLKTIAIGKQQPPLDFSNSLQEYVNKYPKAEPSPLAQQIIKLLADSTLNDYDKLVAIGFINEEIENKEVIEEEKEDQFEGKFSYDGDLLHNFVIAYPSNVEIDINRLKFDLANYNIDHYSKIDFDISTQPLNPNTNMLVVSSLDNKDKALIYFRSIIRKRAVYKSLEGINYVNFVISSPNFRELIEDKNYFEYLKFYVKNYSRFISSNFPKELRNEPKLTAEEQMAEVDKKNTEEFDQKKDGFVVVTPTKEQETAIKKKTFEYSDSGKYAFALTIFDKTFNFSSTISEFKRFAKSNYPNQNFTIEQIEVAPAKIMLVRGLKDVQQAMVFFRDAVSYRQLFKYIGVKRYRNFIISDENITLLKENNDVDGYISFFRTNYIRKQHKQIIKKTKSEDEKQKTQATPQKTKSGYTYNINESHVFALIVPTDGVNHKQLVKDFEQFSKSKGYSTIKFEVKKVDFRTIIKVGRFKNSTDAKQYLLNIITKRTLFKQLSGKTYRNFIISEMNLEQFIKKRNITEYMNFYKANYLKK